jgi:hypothetical protein
MGLLSTVLIRKCRIHMSLMFIAWVICICPPTTSYDISMIGSASIPIINNNIFKYGQYCGPGPDDKFWAHIKPVDVIDQTCQFHDKSYRTCLLQLSKDAGILVADSYCDSMFHNEYPYFYLSLSLTM